jgi:hypothetical protein
MVNKLNPPSIVRGFFMSGTELTSFGGIPAPFFRKGYIYDYEDIN